MRVFALARRREVDAAGVADGRPVVALEGGVKGAVESVPGGEALVVAGISSGAGSADGEGFLVCGGGGLGGFLAVFWRCSGLGCGRDGLRCWVLV